MVRPRKIEIETDNASNFIRRDGRKNFEIRNLIFKLNPITSSLSSFYLQIGSNCILFGLFGPLLNNFKKNHSDLRIKIGILQRFEKFSSLNKFEKLGYETSLVLESILFFRLLFNSKFLIIVRKIKTDGNLNMLLTWASQILFILSGIPCKIKIKISNLGILGDNFLIDPNSEEKFFMTGHLEIISEEISDSTILTLSGSKIKNFANFEKFIGYIENNFFNFIFSKMVPTKYFFHSI